MKVHVERLRRCPVLDCKFAIHGSNGTATTAVLNAESDDRAGSLGAPVAEP
jgi:hypothetical protein